MTGIPHDVSILEDTVCACTGLKDKNGKLIWENDILVGHLDDEYPEDETYEKVIWRKSGFYTVEQGSDDLIELEDFTGKYFEVCGNIFDNPEMLEVGEVQKYRAIGTLEESRYAVDKQRKKKILNPLTSFSLGTCPVCSIHQLGRWRYCSNCGQKLDWGDE